MSTPAVDKIGKSTHEAFKAVPDVLLIRVNVQ
jgi:hypothetical protein